MKGPLGIAVLVLALGLGACALSPTYVGRGIYVSNCTGCHGKAAHGDGPLAAGLGRPVPDLTLISDRNGGKFPMARVISTIDGYTRSREGNTIMPEFGISLQEGPLVNFDSGDGIATPTPSRLVAIAEYIRSIQR